LIIPPVNNVNSSFIMGDVIGKKFAGAWKIKVEAPDFASAAALSVNRPIGLGSQALSNTITELFMKDNTTGSVSLAGTFLNGQPIELENFGDMINELKADNQGQNVDMTLFGYTVDQASYDKTCLDEGGSTQYQACSFANKILNKATGIAPQNLSAQSTNLRMLSWNLGNVALTCPQYIYKLCYRATERSISDQLLSLEQSGGKPDVIFLQEMWHGNCKYNDESNWFTNNFNPRLCAPSLKGTSSIQRILGNSGIRYNYTCSPTTDLPSAPVYNFIADYVNTSIGTNFSPIRYGQIINGYECVAVSTSGNLRLTGVNYSVQPDCVNNPDWSLDYPGRDVGTYFAGATLNGTSVDLGSVHLAGTTSPDCRQTEINKLVTDMGKYAPLRLIAGDFNTQPLTSGTHVDNNIGDAAFRAAFNGPWGSANPAYGSIIDDANQSTSFYLNGNPALDHVISNAFSGYCSRGVDFQGTDHTWTDCRLYR